VYVESATLRSYAGAVAEIEVRCGKGTYIRSIAHDLGQRLECGAHLAALRRTSSGGFGLGDAHSPDVLVALTSEGRLSETLLAPDRAVERRPAAILAAARSADVASGRDVSFESARAADLCRAYSAEGDFLGVLRHRAEGAWHPEKVVGTG